MLTYDIYHVALAGSKQNTEILFKNSGLSAGADPGVVAMGVRSGSAPFPRKFRIFLISKWRIFVDSGEQNSVFLLLKALKTHASVAL